MPVWRFFHKKKDAEKKRCETFFVYEFADKKRFSQRFLTVLIKNVANPFLFIFFYKIRNRIRIGSNPIKLGSGPIRSVGTLDSWVKLL